MKTEHKSDRGPDGLGAVIGIIFGAGFYTGVLVTLLVSRVFG